MSSAAAAVPTTAAAASAAATVGVDENLKIELQPFDGGRRILDIQVKIPHAEGRKRTLVTTANQLYALIATDPRLTLYKCDAIGLDEKAVIRGVSPVSHIDVNDGVKVTQLLILSSNGQVRVQTPLSSKEEAWPSPTSDQLAFGYVLSTLVPKCLRLLGSGTQNDLETLRELIRSDSAVAGMACANIHTIRVRTGGEVLFRHTLPINDRLRWWEINGISRFPSIVGREIDDFGTPLKEHVVRFRRRRDLPADPSNDASEHILGQNVVLTYDAPAASTQHVGPAQWADIVSKTLWSGEFGPNAFCINDASGISDADICELDCLPEGKTTIESVWKFRFDDATQFYTNELEQVKFRDLGMEEEWGKSQNKILRFLFRIAYPAFLRNKDELSLHQLQLAMCLCNVMSIEIKGHSKETYATRVFSGSVGLPPNSKTSPVYAPAHLSLKFREADPVATSNDICLQIQKELGILRTYCSVCMGGRKGTCSSCKSKFKEESVKRFLSMKEKDALLPSRIPAERHPNCPDCPDFSLFCNPCWMVETQKQCVISQSSAKVTTTAAVARPVPAMLVPPPPPPPRDRKKTIRSAAAAVTASASSDAKKQKKDNDKPTPSVVQTTKAVVAEKPKQQPPEKKRARPSSPSPSPSSAAASKKQKVSSTKKKNDGSSAGSDPEPDKWTHCKKCNKKLTDPSWEGPPGEENMCDLCTKKQRAASAAAVRPPIPHAKEEERNEVELVDLTTNNSSDGDVKTKKTSTIKKKKTNNVDDDPISSSSDTDSDTDGGRVITGGRRL